MIRSGIVPIDALCGGFRPRSAYLLTGGAGAGKTVCALRFLGQGLRCGERVVLISHASREELFSRATSLGVDLRAAIREERAVFLRYRTDFVRSVSRAGTAERVFDELRGLITKYRPRRIAIDSFAPLLEDGSASPNAAAALAELLERSEATALLTYSSDVGVGYDRRIEPLVQSAAGIFRLSGHDANGPQLRAVTIRHAISAPAGEVALLPSASYARDESLLHGAEPLLLCVVSEAAAEDLLATLRLQHEVVVPEAETPDFASRFAALVIETDHKALDRARTLVRSSAAARKPIIVLSRFNLRSLDRARLLRDGADEVLAGDMGAPELLQRLATALSRGHLQRPPHAVHEDESLTQSAIVGPGELLDRDRFAAALQARSAHDDAVPFTVVRLTTAEDEATERRAVGTLALSVMRVASGDLAALLDDGVAIYLHGAGRRDAAPFLDRLRARRPAGAPPLRVDMASFPVDGAAVRQLVEPLEVR
jgi:KaiC/GvpD/RAD55 family RecA-like ATPase